MQKSIHSLSDKIVFVAGNAKRLSQGIIKPLLQAGATVIVPAISLQEITDLKKYVGNDLPGHLITQLLDVPDCDQITTFTETIWEKFGRLDLAVSAIECTSNTQDLSAVKLAVWQKMQDTDINLFFTCARITLPLLKQAPDALLVSVCHSSYHEPLKQAGLAALAHTMRTDMSRRFWAEAQQQHTRYYHVEVPHLNKQKESVTAPPANYDLVGNYILQLYNEPQKQTGNMFQLFSPLALA